MKVLLLLFLPIYLFGQNKPNDSIFPRMNEYTLYSFKKIKKIDNSKYLKEQKSFLIILSKTPKIINNAYYYLVFFNSRPSNTYLKNENGNILIVEFEKDSIVSKNILVNFSNPNKKDTIIVNGLGELYDHKMYFDTIIYSNRYDSIYIYKLQEVIHGWYCLNNMLWKDHVSNSPDKHYEIGFSKKYGIVSITKKIENSIYCFTPKKKLSRRESAKLKAIKHYQESLVNKH